MSWHSGYLPLLFVLIIISSLFCSCFSKEKTEPEPDVPKNAEEFKNSYIKMLINKRKSQQEAVKHILKMNDKKKENEMLKLLLSQLFDTLKGSLETLAKLQKDEASKGLKLDKNSMPDVSSIIENTAFAADLSLHFPKFFHKLYDKNENWQFILEAAIGITLQVGLIDDETSKGINLMSQELNIIEKDPNFQNPYRHKKVVEEPKPQKEVIKKKEKKKRGPGLSGGKYDL